MLFYVLRPLFRGADVPLPQDEDLVELISRKESTLAAIKDLELDYKMGKLTPEDYQRFDARLRRQAINYLKQIEMRMPGSPEDNALEAEIAQFRQSPSATEPDDGPVEPSVRHCEECDSAVAAEHRFCPNCGTPIEPA